MKKTLIGKAQKVNPIVLRLNSKFYENNFFFFDKSTANFYKNLMLIKIIENIACTLKYWVILIKIFHGFFFKIFVFYFLPTILKKNSGKRLLKENIFYALSRFLKVSFRIIFINLKKILIKKNRRNNFFFFKKLFPRLKNNFYFLDLIQSLFIIKEIPGTLPLLNKIILIFLKKFINKNIKYIFYNISNILELFFKKKSIKGLKLLLKGRLENKPRKKKMVLNFGKIFSQKICNIELEYYESKCFTKNGVLNVSAWFCR